jgi:RND family efflux transporter MFP subunit
MMLSVRSVASSTGVIASLALLLGLVVGGGAVVWYGGPYVVEPPAAHSSHDDMASMDGSSEMGMGADSTGEMTMEDDSTGRAGSSSGQAAGLAKYDTDGDGYVYQGGMHPDIVRDEPGQCPICGMDLTRTPIGEQEGSTVKVSPATVQNIGVRSQTVAVEPLARTVRTTGRFEANERLATAVAPKVGGWVETLHVDYEGARVQKGEPLFDLYSPQLVATQEEYLAALRTADRLGSDDGAQRLVDAARRRLSYWDISEDQIKSLEETRTPMRTLTFTAPSTGTVTTKKITEGEKLSPGQTLFHITGLSPLWLMVDVYEQDLSWIDVGSRAQVELPYSPGRTVTGRVEYIYDEVDTDTRTVRARIAVPNPNRTLKPGMYATVRLSGGEATPHPVVPSSAIVSSGEREIVIRALGDGRFRPVPVHTGRSADGRTQVLHGLDGGERVVTSAQFLIDSEARLSGALAAMDDSTSMQGAGHQH